MVHWENIMFVVTSYYRKIRNGRYPNSTERRKRFKKEAHAMHDAVKQRAKGKYVEVGQIVSSALILEMLS